MRKFFPLTLLHSEWPKLHRVLAFLTAIGLNDNPLPIFKFHFMGKQMSSQKLFAFVKITENKEVYHSHLKEYLSHLTDPIQFLPAILL